MSAAPSPRRTDAAYNDERILNGAVRQLSEDPMLGMAELAERCGVSRSSLFRRYPSRDQLIAAARERAHVELDAAVLGAHLEDGEPGEALGRLVHALLSVVGHYSFLDQHRAEKGHDERLRVTAEQIEGLILRGQASGCFSCDDPARWWVRVIVALMSAALRELKTRPPEEVAARLERTLLQGLTGH